MPGKLSASLGGRKARLRPPAVLPVRLGVPP